MCKILNELVEIPNNYRLIPADRRTRGGHNQAYKHLRANTTMGQNYFGSELSAWNSLPAVAIESITVAAFKSPPASSPFQPDTPHRSCCWSSKFKVQNVLHTGTTEV